MADIIMLNHAFSFHTSGESFSPELSNLLRRLSFNGEGLKLREWLHWKYTFT